MSCNCDKTNKVKTIKIADIAIDSVASLPDYILAERDIQEEETGNVKRAIVRVPSHTLFPNANNDNVLGLAINNMAITIPEKQVRAGYIQNAVGGNIMQYADANNHARFLMLGKHVDNVMRVQNTGFVVIPEGHNYIVGAQYYLGNDGEPVTDATVTGQRLFVPESSTVLSINMDH